MFINFFLELKQAGVPVSIKEYLTLMGAMEKGCADYDVDHFYYLSRSALVKDERNLDKFDRVFGHVFNGLEKPEGEMQVELPEEWLRKLAELHLTDEEKAQIEAMGGWEKLMETLRQRLAEQKGRHQGGNKWVGTGGAVALRRLWLQPRGRAHRSARVPPSPRRQGVGQAASSRISMTASSSVPAISRSRCGACASSPARGCRPSSTCRTPSSATAHNARLPRHQDGARAA